MQDGRIYQKSGAWMLQWYRKELVDGKVVTKRVARKLAPVCNEYRTKASVQPLAQEILSPINTRAEKPTGTQTVADFLEHQYLPHCEETLRPSTVRGYKDMFKLVAPHLGEARLRDFRTADADRLLRTVAEKQRRAHTTFRNLKCFLSAGFRYAKRCGAIDGVNPISDAGIPRGKATGKKHAYSLDEIQAMLAVVAEPARTLMLTAALTGLRKSEIQGLRWTDFTGSELLVSRSVWNGKVSETKTLSSHAAVPVLPILSQALAEHKAKNAGDGYCFHGSKGEPLRLENLVRREIRPALAKAGLAWYGWHAFRRGLGTNLHALGTQVKTIQDILRHANVSTTFGYYIRPVAAEALAAMDKLSEAFARSGARSVA